MYSFDPTEEQQMLLETLRRYARNDLRPAARTAEESGLLPADWLVKGWDLGLLQGSIPEVYGGFGERSVLTGALAAEALAWGDLAGALALLTPGLFAFSILSAGDEQQKLAWLPQLLSGSWQPYSAALIEPVFDFDPHALQTTARLDDASYILNGVKAWVPFAQDAPAMVVFANQAGETRAFIVPAGAAGLRVGEREKLMSLNALPLYRVHLEGVRVPASALLPGDFSPILAYLRVANGALAVGLAQAAFEYARDYAKEREAFGAKIAQKQAIAFMLAEMATEIEAIRLLTWEAAWMLDTNHPEAANQAYLAAMGAADMAMNVTDRAVQILGGHGYIREHPVEMWMRNGRSIASLTGLAMV